MPQPLTSYIVSAMHRFVSYVLLSLIAVSFCLTTVSGSHASMHMADMDEGSAMVSHEHMAMDHADMTEHEHQAMQLSAQHDACDDGECHDQAMQTCCSAMAGGCGMVVALNLSNAVSYATCRDLHEAQGDQIALGRMPEAETPPPRA